MWEKAELSLKSAGAAALAVTLVCLTGRAGAQAVGEPEFMPHGFCYMWDQNLLLLHVIADVAIALAYFCIPIALLYVVRKRGDLPFNWIFWMFGGFIVSCGITHLMEVWTIWHATYWLAGTLKAVTATISLLTAVMMIPLAPKMVALPSPAQLQDKNRDLQLAMAERELTEGQLRVSLRQKEAALAALADRQEAVKELQLVQVALHESQDRLNAIIHSAMDAIITVDEEQRVLIFNAAAEEMFGYKAAEVVGGPLKRLVPRAFYPSYGRELGVCGASGPSRWVNRVGAISGVRANGQKFPLEASVSKTQVSGKTLVTVIFRDVSERSEAQEMRERLAAVVDSSEDAIIGRDLDGIINAWNGGAQKIYGYTAEEALGQPIGMLIPPEYAQEEAETLGPIRRGESVQHFETVRVRKDGKRVDVSVTTSPVRDSSGAVVGASKIARDITEAKAKERALRESEERFEAVANGIQQLAWMADAEGSIFWYNRRWYEYTGTTFEQMQGWGWQSVHDPKSLDSVLAQWKRAIAAGVTFDMEFPLRGADGSFRMFLTRAMPVRGGTGGVRWFGTNTDISERKQSEERLSRLAEDLLHSQHELEAQKQMLQSVLDSMDEGLIAADESCRFTLWNKAAEKMVGSGPKDIHFQEWSEAYGAYLEDGVTLLPPEDSPLVRAVRGETCAMEIILRHPKAGGDVWVEIAGAPVRDGEGVARGGVVAMRDITHRKATEREIEKLNEDLKRRVAELNCSNQELEQFAYVASHDLQEPLRMVASYTQLLGERYRGRIDETADKFIGYASEGAQRMQVLIQDLLAFSRVGRTGGPPEELETAVVVEGVKVNLMAAIQESGAAIQYDHLPAVWADRPQMTQVFQNLIGNAIKFHRPGVAPEIRVSAKRVGADWQFSVSDNGIGMRIEYLENIFVVFQRLHARTEYPGNGIGLAICKKIVEYYGGNIWVESEVGKGSTFKFTLPAAIPQAARAVTEMMGAAI